MDPDLEKAKAGVLSATMEVLKLSEERAKTHALCKFGLRIVELAHQVKAEQAYDEHVAQLVDSMKGELNAGIGAQIQSECQRVMQYGAEYFADLIEEDTDKKRQKELEAKGDLTSTEQEELGTLKGRHYDRLRKEFDRDNGEGMSAEDKAAFMEYNRRHQEAVAAELKAKEAAKKAQDQAIADAKRAEADRITGEAIAKERKERARAEQQRKEAAAKQQRSSSRNTSVRRRG